MPDETQFIERNIVIALIVSDEYMDEFRQILQVRLFKDSTAKRLVSWCLEYYDKYGKSPKEQIEAIYFVKLKEGLPEEIAEEIEEDILPNLSKEYIDTGINYDYIRDQSHIYFQERVLELHVQEIEAYVADGDITKAQQLAMSYAIPVKNTEVGLDLSSDDAIARISKAFADSAIPVVGYPKQLGYFWNSQLIRGGFVALMGSEKRGKSYWLLDMAIRATRQGRKVAFFQAGDMTEGQQLRRICISLAKRSDKEKYIGVMYQPIRDCVHNQLDTCERSERESNDGAVWVDKTTKQLRRETTKAELIEAYKDNPDHSPCHNCRKYQTSRWGAPWLQKVHIKHTLSKKEAKQTIDKYFKKYKGKFMLSTHANDTLTVSHIKSLLSTWEKHNLFIPDVIIVDYADLLVAEKTKEHRHQQNEIWKALRGLSQEKHCLVMTVTQADADSYGRGLLTMKNFSEDKRKFAHVTAMYGLNQDPQGHEKDIGLMRINELVIREGESNPHNAITVCQNLQRGLPYIQAYF